MFHYSIDSNEKLLHKLPDILGTVSPSHSSPEFKEFYKFCFNYVKSGGPVGAKNIELDMAIEFLAMALDRSRFSTTYTPPIDAAEPTTVRSTTLSSTKADGDFPHLYAFVEFLKAKTPVKVMNRDQWESFVPFNKSVGWDLEGYSEDGACEFFSYVPCGQMSAILTGI